MCVSGRILELDQVLRMSLVRQNSGRRVAAHCGIDVAFAKRKTLPIAVCVNTDSGLSPLALRDPALPKPPRGAGNRLALDPATVSRFAMDTVTYLRDIERCFEVKIGTVAIDAPRDYADEGRRRACEEALDFAGLSCFATPSRSQFDEIRTRAHSHLAGGGAEARLPHANQLWMLAGFELFRQLEQEFDCIEVFPNAIVRTLDMTTAHKSTAEGLKRQMEILERGTGISFVDIQCASYGTLHDRVDALLSAWVACSNKSSRIAFGDGYRDTIWTVRFEGLLATDESDKLEADQRLS